MKRTKSAESALARFLALDPAARQRVDRIEGVFVILEDAVSSRAAGLTRAEAAGLLRDLACTEEDAFVVECALTWVYDYRVGRAQAAA